MIINVFKNKIFPIKEPDEYTYDYTEEDDISSRSENFDLDNMSLISSLDITSK